MCVCAKWIHIYTGMYSVYILFKNKTSIVLSFGQFTNRELFSFPGADVCLLLVGHDCERNFRTSRYTECVSARVDVLLHTSTATNGVNFRRTGVTEEALMVRSLSISSGCNFSINLVPISFLYFFILFLKQKKCAKLVFFLLAQPDLLLARSTVMRGHGDSCEKLLTTLWIPVLPLFSQYSWKLVSESIFLFLLIKISSVFFFLLNCLHNELHFNFSFFFFNLFQEVEA